MLRTSGMVRVRCEPICGIWRYMLQASHNKLEACCALMGKVAGCKLRCVVLACAHILPSFLPSASDRSPPNPLHLLVCSLTLSLHLSFDALTGCITRLWHILRQRRNVSSQSMLAASNSLELLRSSLTVLPSHLLSSPFATQFSEEEYKISRYC